MRMCSACSRSPWRSAKSCAERDDARVRSGDVGSSVGDDDGVGLGLVGFACDGCDCVSDGVSVTDSGVAPDAAAADSNSVASTTKSHTIVWSLNTT